MSETKNSRFADFCLFMTSVWLPAVSAYHFVVFNPIAPVLQGMFNRTYVKRYNETLTEASFRTYLALTSSSIIIGGFVGALCTRQLLIWVSRKRLLQATHFFFLPAVLLTAIGGKLTEAWEVFIIGRLLTGLPIGIFYTLTPLMVAEMSARNQQSLWQSVVGIAIGFGILIGAVLAHPKIFGNEALWPVAVLLSMVPPIIYLISSWWIPPTLYSLAKTGDKEKTMKVIRKMRIGSEEDFEAEYHGMTREMKGTKAINILDIFKIRQYRMHCIVVLCLFLNLILGGINVFVLYSDQLFISAGIPKDKVTFGTIGIFAGQFLVSIVGSKLIEKFGGRKVMLTASVMEIIGLLIYTVTQATLHLAPDVLPYLAIVGSAMFIVAWSGGTNLATLALMGAVTIEPTRPACFSAGNILFWIFSWFTGFIPTYLQAALGPYNMCPWLACVSIFLVYFVFYLPETKGRSVDEIQRHFSIKRTASSMPLTEKQKA